MLSFEKMPEKMGTAKEKPTDTSHIVGAGLTSAKTPLKNGMYMHRSRQMIDTATAKSMNGFEKNGTENNVFSSLLHSKT